MEFVVLKVAKKWFKRFFQALQKNKISKNKEGYIKNPNNPYIQLLQPSGGIQMTQVMTYQVKKKKKVWNTLQQWLFLDTMTPLLKVIHRHRCEQFHVGTIVSPPNCTCQLNHRTEGSIDLLMDERLVLVTVWYVNFNGVLLGMTLLTTVYDFVLERDIPVESFKCIFLCVLSTTCQVQSSSVIFEGRQTSLPPKLSSSHYSVLGE